MQLGSVERLTKTESAEVLLWVIWHGLFVNQWQASEETRKYKAVRKLVS